MTSKPAACNYDTEFSKHIPFLSTLRSKELSGSKMKWWAIYTNLPVNAIVRLPHPRSGDSQSQEAFLAPSADKHTHNYDTECSNHHPSLSAQRPKGLSRSKMKWWPVYTNSKLDWGILIQKTDAVIFHIKCSSLSMLFFYIPYNMLHKKTTLLHNVFSLITWITKS